MAKAIVKEVIFLLRKRFLSTSTGLSSLPKPYSSFTFDFLESCGLSSESALSISGKLQIDKDKQYRPQSVLNFLKCHCFSDTQIAEIVGKYPPVLFCGVEDNLKPKVEFFIQSGFEGKVLHELVLINPQIFRRSLDSHIKPCIEFLKLYLDSNEKIRRVIKRASWMLTSFDFKKTLERNVQYLIEEGMPIRSVAKLIVLNPRAVLRNHEKIFSAVNDLRKLGIEPNQLVFVHALRVILQMTGSTWKTKLEMMKSMGWSEEDILSAFKRDPLFLAISETKFRRAMDFYVNTMGLEPQSIILYPKFLMFSIDKRLVPRYNVLKLLDSKKLLSGRNRKSIKWQLTISEHKFLKKFVIKFQDKIPGILDMYRAGVVGVTGSKA